MAARKPSTPKKKQAAPRAKKAPPKPAVLGNDPFARGSAVREISTQAPAAPPPRAPARPVTPELQEVRRPVLQPIDEKPRSGSGVAPPPPRFVPPPTVSPVRPGPRASTPKPPTAHAGSPSLSVDPRPHAGAPTAQILSGPAAHAGSPSVSFEPRSHPGTPTAQPLSGPAAHAGSPSVSSFEPRSHPGAPTAQPLSGPAAHAGSPSVSSFEPRSHPGAPTAQPLSGPAAHAGSPSVTFEPKAHSGAPTAQPLNGATAHAGSPSVSFDPRPHAGAPSVTFEAQPHPGSPAPLAPLATVADTLAPATLTGALKGLFNAARSSAGLASRATEVDRWGKDAALATSLRPLGELLYDKYWRVRVEGAEHLPPGPFIIVANHAGALPLDGPVLHLALRRERPDLEESRWLLEDQVFHAPFVGVLANRLGAVRASPENALRLLDEKRPLIVFPEGFHGLSKPFSERYQLKRFGRGGYVKIALRARVPIVPVAIIGGEESMPLLGKLPAGLFGLQYLPITLPPLPARWHIRFAPPISLEGAPSEPEHDLAWVEQTNLAVRDQIEAMLVDMLQHRDRIF